VQCSQERAAAAGSRFPFPSYPLRPYDRQFQPSGTPGLFLTVPLPEPVGANVATALQRGERTRKMGEQMDERTSDKDYAPPIGDRTNACRDRTARISS